MEKKKLEDSQEYFQKNHANCPQRDDGIAEAEKRHEQQIHIKDPR